MRTCPEWPPASVAAISAANASCCAAVMDACALAWARMVASFYCPCYISNAYTRLLTCSAGQCWPQGNAAADAHVP